ncbi:MAG: phosphatidate cytidylyltransferase [Ignavibacteria bacterium]
MSNMVKRILVGIIGIPLVIYVCYLGGIAFLIFSLIVTSAASWEFYSMFERKGLMPMKITSILAAAAVLLLSYFIKRDFLLYQYIFIVFFIMAEILRKENKNPLNPVIVIFALLYITAPFIMLSQLIERSNFNLVIYIFVLIWVCDSAAYFGGKIFGKHMLSSISPKKTWEGSITGFILTIGISLIVHLIYPESLLIKDALISGLIVGIFSQAGDLFESLIKRYCGVKDSSEIIPGHGGILDRFDSLIFVAPLIFIYFIYIK